jgi:hypothetical protein
MVSFDVGCFGGAVVEFDLYQSLGKLRPLLWSESQLKVAVAFENLSLAVVASRAGQGFAAAPEQSWISLRSAFEFGA